MKKQKKRSVFLRGGWQMLLCCLLVPAMILLNMGLTALGPALRFDATESGVYTLTETTKALLSSLQDEVKILCVQESASDSRLIELLNRYSAASDRIIVGAIDASQSLYYSSEELADGTVIVTNDEHDVVIPYEELYAAEYEPGPYGQTLSSYGFAAENALNAAIANVSADLPIAYTLAGHNETALQSGFKAVLGDQGYHTKNLYLAELDKIPEDCGMIVISVPQMDISEAEADRLISWVDGGGSLFVLTDGKYGNLPQMARVMAHVGMQAIPGVVVEGDAEYMYGSDYPYYLQPQYCAESGLFFEQMLEAVMPVRPLMALANAISFTGEGEYTPAAALETSDASFVKPNAYVDGVVSYADGDEFGPFCVAAVSEKQGAGKVFWMISSQCFADAVDQMVSGANYTLASNAAAWMRGGEMESLVASVPPKSILSPTIGLTVGQVFLYGGVCVGVPAVIFIIGAILCAKRHRKAVSVETK